MTTGMGGSHPVKQGIVASMLLGGQGRKIISVLLLFLQNHPRRENTS